MCFQKPHSHALSNIAKLIIQVIMILNEEIKCKFHIYFYFNNNMTNNIKKPQFKFELDIIKEKLTIITNFTMKNK